jgi:tRNA(Ile)-lysidine synthase
MDRHAFSMLARHVRRIIQEKNLIASGERVLVGVSGGIDSSVLLHILLKVKETLQFSVGVAHVNHGLRGAESDRDEVFVRGVAERFIVPFHARRVDVRSYARAEGLSLQHSGRNLRYSYFSELAHEHGYDKIAIGHTRDDQVETFIMRLLKGTGLRGLSSIPIRRGPVIRPLLQAYRSEIEAYATEELVPYVEDSSNKKDTYQRNFIRNRLTPAFEELNPNFRERILFLLDDLTRLNELFDQDARAFMEREVTSGADGAMETGVGALGGLHPETRYRVLSGMLEHLRPGLVPLRDHIRLMEGVIESVRPNVDVTLPRGITARRAYDRFCLGSTQAPEAVHGPLPITLGRNYLETFRIALDAETTEEWPQQFPGDSQTAFFDFDMLGPLSVRTFREGDRFVPLGMSQSVKLKDFFISRKIPLHERRRIPLLLSDDRIIWVIGARIDDHYKVTPETRRLLRVVVTSEQ